MWTPATRGRMAEFEKKTKRHSRRLDSARVLTSMPGVYVCGAVNDSDPYSLCLRAAAGRGQSFVTATQSTSTSKGPVHSGTQKKMRAGGFFGKSLEETSLKARDRSAEMHSTLHFSTWSRSVPAASSASIICSRISSTWRSKKG